jgi:thiamine kinase-like enzyme
MKVAYVTLFIYSLLLIAAISYFLCCFFRNWLKTAKSLCTPEEAKDFRLDSIEDEISLIEKELSGDQSIGFCHNDLQYGNIMIDEETRSITIIVSSLFI